MGVVRADLICCDPSHGLDEVGGEERGDDLVDIGVLWSWVLSGNCAGCGCKGVRG